jgi:hypothetical protein
MSVEDRPEALPTKWASLKSRERHRSRRVTATLIATCLACIASVVQAPVAGAANHAAKRTPAVGIVRWDVFTTDSNNNLIQVDPRFTRASAPLFNLDGNPLGLTWGQWRSATASSLARTITKKGIDYTGDDERGDPERRLLALLPNVQPLLRQPDLPDGRFDDRPDRALPTTPDA